MLSAVSSRIGDLLLSTGIFTYRDDFSEAPGLLFMNVLTPVTIRQKLANLITNLVRGCRITQILGCDDWIGSFMQHTVNKLHLA